MLRCRRVQTLFARSAHWKGYDVFKRQKDAAFASSSKAVHELVVRFNEVLKMDRNLQARALFDEMIQISLWGNATDLSLLSTIANGALESMQGISAMEASKAKIVDDDSEALWQHMASTRQVDIVLDNAGFEFLTDLILAAYLLHAGLAQKVVLHTKAFGWFVSDVTPSDVESTLAALEDPTVFSERESLDPFCRMFRDHFTRGKISVAPVSTFWTTYHPFSDLAKSDPGLLKTLEASSLVIFKGDLNYRKLTADKTWPYTTLFDVALEDLRKSRMHILALRTNKADVCVGLRNEDQVAELESLSPGAGWVSNGEYAVISFSTATSAMHCGTPCHRRRVGRKDAVRHGSLLESPDQVFSQLANLGFSHSGSRASSLACEGAACTRKEVVGGSFALSAFAYDDTAYLPKISKLETSMWRAPKMPRSDMTSDHWGHRRI